MATIRHRHLVVLLAFALCVGGVARTYTNFSTQTSNSSAVGSGSVVLTNNSSGASLVAASNMAQYASVSSCVNVTFTGSLPSTVSLYSAATGTGLDDYVDLVVTRGTLSGTFPLCTGFVADSTTYLTGQAPGVMWAGLLSAFPASSGTLVDPAIGQTATVWSTNAVHGYRFDFTLRSDAAGAAKTVASTFTWEASNT